MDLCKTSARVHPWTMDAPVVLLIFNFWLRATVIICHSLTSRLTWIESCSVVCRQFISFPRCPIFLLNVFSFHFYSFGFRNFHLRRSPFVSPKKNQEIALRIYSADASLQNSHRSYSFRIPFDWGCSWKPDRERERLFSDGRIYDVLLSGKSFSHCRERNTNVSYRLEFLFPSSSFNNPMNVEKDEINYT